MGAKVELKKGTPASADALRALEAALGRSLSRPFKAFVQSNDGARPESNTFRIASNNSSSVRRFIPVNEILERRSTIDDIPKSAYPIAEDENGNYVVIDEDKGGAVFFWDHELPVPLTPLAGDFNAFLALLEPFDSSQIKLQPGQVKRVWIDPEFLKKLKKDQG